MKQFSLKWWAKIRPKIKGQRRFLLLFAQFLSDFENSRFILTRIVSRTHTFFPNKNPANVARTAMIFVCVIEVNTMTSSGSLFKSTFTSVLSCFSVTSETLRGWQFCGRSYAIPQFKSITWDGSRGEHSARPGLWIPSVSHIGWLYHVICKRSCWICWCVALVLYINKCS